MNFIQIIRQRLRIPECFTFITVLSLYIVANIMQLFNDQYDNHHFPLVITVNVFIGISIAQMLDEICHSIIDHLSITAPWIRNTIMMTIIFHLIMSLIHYYFIENLAKIQVIFYSNIAITSFILITMTIISKCRCIHINSGFDLIEMQTIEPLTNNDNVEAEDQIISNEMISSTGNQSFYRTDGKRRKQSMASILAYRMRYRIESIVSTFNSK